jgi:hypothetical protein
MLTKTDMKDSEAHEPHGYMLTSPRWSVGVKVCAELY